MSTLQMRQWWAWWSYPGHWSVLKGTGRKVTSISSAPDQGGTVMSSSTEVDSPWGSLR